MIRKYLNELKETWRLAAVTYLIAVVINLITGWSMDRIIVGIFGTLTMVIILWVIYEAIKEKLNKY